MFRKMFLSLFAITCLVIESYASYGVGPINKSCLLGDINCIVAANVRAAIPCLADGIPELGIRGLDPINLYNITSDQGFFKLQFPSMRVFGSRQCKSVATTIDTLQNTMVITMDCPFEAIGKYILTATSYVFDINNEGNYALQSEPMRTTLTYKYEIIYGSNGKQYMNVLDYEFFYEPLNKFYIELGNLFSGNIDRGTFFFNLMPNSWGLSMAKIGEPIVNSIVASFHQVFKAAFVHLPLN